MTAVNRDRHRLKIHMSLHVERGEAGQRTVHPRRPDPVDTVRLVPEQPRPVDVEREVGERRKLQPVFLDEVADARLFKQELQAFPCAIQLVGRSSQSRYFPRAAVSVSFGRPSIGPA